MMQKEGFAIALMGFAVLLTCGLAYAAEQSPAVNAPVRFQQDRFAIGFWVDPPLDDKADARYKEIADANFTLVIGGFGARGLDAVEKQLALCEEYDLKALVACGEAAPTQFPESPACWGYMLRDEPSASDFPALAKQVQAIREARPGRLAYINLFPDYAPLGALGTEDYDTHVRRFVDEVNVDALSMDHYPIFKPSGDGRDGYCGNLAVMRKYALEKGIPFWNFFNTMPYGPHTDPTEGQLRWQIYTSLAYGAKGVLYFCYYTPAGGEFPKGGAIIARDDQRTRHWHQAQRINHALKAMGPTLMKLASTAVYRVGPDDDAAEVLKNAPIVNLIRADVDPPNDYLIGVFKHEDGRRAVLLNNYRFAFTAWPTVVFDAPVEQVAEIDKHTGEERSIRDDSPAMEGLQLSLDSGEGRLFLLPLK
jgi:hypothetical protein